MKPKQSIPHENIKIPEELLISFAKAMAPEIREFYQSDAGKDYYLQWLRHHPEYDCSHLLRNKRYIGICTYGGMETPGGMPRILDDDLFYRVQDIMDRNKNTPARTRGDKEYLLTTKLFCGHCREMMIGYGGTGKSGKAYHYYICKNARKKRCEKKVVSKVYIENRVVEECLKLLTPENIAFIAKMVAEECSKDPDNLTIRELKKSIREANQAIENLWRAIEQGQAVDMLSDRLTARQEEKKRLEEQLAIEENKRVHLTEPQIRAFLDFVREMPTEDINKSRTIINIFVHSVYLYDDHFALLINASGKPISVEDIPLDDIEAAFEGETGIQEGCSTTDTPVPPAKNRASSQEGALFFLGSTPTIDIEADKIRDDRRVNGGHLFM